MKKAILFLLLLATMPMQTTAQVNPQKGYVITNGNDTVHGTIDYLTDARNAKECLFQRRGEDAYKSLSPADIKGYRLADDGIYYVSRMFYAEGPGAPRYGGDVSAMRWSSYELSPKRGYKFSYDNAGRLTQASYGEGDALTSNADRFSEGVQYDDHGNPQTIYFTNGNETRYMYDASGRKLRVTHHVAKPNVTRAFGVRPVGSTQDEVLFAGQTDYLLGGSLVVRDGSIDKALFDGGYAKGTRLGATTYGFTPYYYNKDHLGNIREVVSMGGTVQQVTNYYPFGAPYADPNAVMGANVQPYKYNGKELDRMHGLDTYDYGARQYDLILARWDRVDPLCEKYYGISPYVYCGNNPINAIDDKGDSTCVLNYGSGSNQHLAMLIQNDEGKWSYFSFNGIKIFNSTSGISGGAPHNNLGERSFDSPTVFLNSIYNSDGSYEEIEHDRINGYGYTEGYILPTTPKEDKKIKYNFMKAVNEGYNLLKNQCTNSVQKALNSVGVKTTTINKFNYSTTSGAVYPMPPHYTVGVNPYLPSLAFKAIRDNNPNGIYIKR